jgi:hypothetical protein
VQIEAIGVVRECGAGGGGRAFSFLRAQRDNLVFSAFGERREVLGPQRERGFYFTFVRTLVVDSGDAAFGATSMI